MSLPSSTTHRRGPFSQGSFQAILAGLSQERDALRHDVERLERQERALVDNEEALVRKHQSLILTSRHVQEELGVVRRQEVMLREQKQQLQKVLESDRREMDAATEQQVALEQDRIQRKRAFIRDMEKRNEHLSHALSQEHDGMWNRRLSAETAQLMWTKVMQWQQQQQQQHGDDPTNNNVLKELKESVDHLTRVWTQLSHMVEMYERNQDERMQMRAFILEHRDEQEDHNVVSELTMSSQCIHLYIGLDALIAHFRIVCMIAYCSPSRKRSCWTWSTVGRNKIMSRQSISSLAKAATMARITWLMKIAS